MSSTSSAPSTQIVIRGTLLGDYAVGKSSLFQRYVFNNTDYYPTIGVDFQSQTHSLRGHTVRLQLWDTAGQERFRSIIQAYVRNVFVCFLVFDVTRRVTFEHLDDWIRFVEENNTGDYLCVVVANKVDKPMNEWQVLPAEMDAFVQDKGLFGLYLVSANAGLHNAPYNGPHQSSQSSPQMSTLATTRATTLPPITETSPLPPTLHPKPTPVYQMFSRVLERILDYFGVQNGSVVHLSENRLQQPDRRITVRLLQCEPVVHVCEKSDTNKKSESVDELRTPPGSPTHDATSMSRVAMTHFRKTSSQSPPTVFQRRRGRSTRMHEWTERCQDWWGESSWWTRTSEESTTSSRNDRSNNRSCNGC